MSGRASMKNDPRGPLQRGLDRDRADSGITSL